MNRKSVAGTAACFLGSLANTAFSPRGIDDFTMATGNALLCWAFGRLVY